MTNQTQKRIKKYTGYIKIKISLLFLFFSTMMLLSLIQNMTSLGCFAFIFNWTMWLIYFIIDIMEQNK